jgi:cytoskeleton protein RodZ
MANLAPAPQMGDGPAPRPRETVGDQLRLARVEHGGEIEGIAHTLRIRPEYLAAIEQGRYDRLPGPVYALGFVRTYALHLGLDGDEAVRRFKLEAAGFEQRRDLSFPMPLAQRSVPGGRMLLAAIVLAVCAYGMWHYLSTGDRNRPERVAAVPSDLMPPPPPAPAPAPSASDAGAPPSPNASAMPADPSLAGAQAAPAPSAVTVAPLPPPVTVTPLPPPVAMAPVPAPPPAPDVSAAAPTVAANPPPAAPSPVAMLQAPVPGAHVFGAIDGPSRITLRAAKDVWIQVRDSDPSQTVVAQRTLRAGDSYRVPDRSGLMLRTGNATGLQIAVDDKPAPALNGTVRNVALDPARLRAGTAGAE